MAIAEIVVGPSIGWVKLDSNFKTINRLGVMLGVVMGDADTKTVDALMKLELPSGVEVEIKV